MSKKYSVYDTTGAWLRQVSFLTRRQPKKALNEIPEEFHKDISNVTIIRL